MGTYTTNLNLYNTNMTTDGNDTFDFQRDINDNNDKIDTAVGNLSSLNTSSKTSLVVAINEVLSNCGALTSLTTTDKTNLVSAINEVVTGINGKASEDLDDLSETGELHFANPSLSNLDFTGNALLADKASKTQNNTISGMNTFTASSNSFADKLEIRASSSSVYPILYLHAPSTNHACLRLNNSTGYLECVKGDQSAYQAFVVANSATVGTAIATSAISKAQNGYLKLGNGVIFQWGYKSDLNGATNKTITFPTSFSNTNYAISVIGYDTSHNADSNTQAYSIKTKNNANCVISLGSSDGQHNGSYWMAIGY